MLTQNAQSILCTSYGDIDLIWISDESKSFSKPGFTWSVAFYLRYGAGAHSRQDHIWPLTSYTKQFTFRLLNFLCQIYLSHITHLKHNNNIFTPYLYSAFKASITKGAYTEMRKTIKIKMQNNKNN